jgi:transcriptional regulator with XRE-family HTH domain
MPPRPHPTARQARLGAELRKLREAAGITARDAGRLLGASQTQISHIESGRFGISEERLRRLAGHYACGDAALIGALGDMAGERGKGWWEEFRGVVAPEGLDLAELESHAQHFRTFQVVHIPGHFQTEEHMRAMFRYTSNGWSREDLDAHVAFRLQRQQRVLFRAESPPFEVVIHEAALRFRVGGRKVVRAQLERILEMIDLDQVMVRVVPFDNEDFAGAGHSMLYLSGPVPQLDTVQIDTGHGGVFLDAVPRLKVYRDRFDKVHGTALAVEDSRQLIGRIAREL